MSLNLNKLILAGRIASDFELKQTPGGATVTTIRLAVTRKRTSKDSQKQPETDFFNVTAWNGTAEFLSKYFRKGSAICIFARIQNRVRIEQDGRKQYFTDIIAEEVNFVDSRGAQGGASDDAGGADGEAGFDSYTENPDLKFEECLNASDDLPF